MPELNYRVTENSTGLSVVVAFDPSRDKPVLTANEAHPNFARIVAALRAGDPAAFDMFDVVQGVTNQFKEITDRVSWDGRNVLWDGDVANNLISEQLARAISNGEGNYRALARFWEKLETNPEPHSREMAYQWLSSHEFKITEDGDVIGYKGLSRHGKSTRQGHAFVDGKEFSNDYIPNDDGTVVSMPRSEVAHDPDASCHTGLHIGTWEFASRFSSGETKLVVFSPRDIVSVPRHGHDKVRVCRYRVARTVEAPLEGGEILPLEAVASVGWSGVGYEAR